MTATSAVLNAWNEYVFSTDEIEAITDKCLELELRDVSEFDIESVSHEEKINFFEIVVTRTPNYPTIGGALNPEYTFTVEVRYTVQIEEGYSNRRDASDALDAFQDAVQDSLGATWQGTVLFWNPQPVQPITIRSVANTACWSWVARYVGVFRN